MIFMFNLLFGAIIGSGTMFVLSLIVIPIIDWFNGEFNWENMSAGAFVMTLVGFVVGMIAGAMAS
jgi:hypothetical protein